MTDTPPRPSSVPLAAVWLASAGEWQRGELVNGKLEGKVQNWRKDGTLCCEAHYVDGEADGPFCRTHENGEASQFGAMAKGKRSGLCTWVRSTAPTTEIPGMPNPLIWRVEADFSPDTQSIQRQFDKSGNELNGQAMPIPQRPTGVAPFATYVLRGSGTLQLRLWEDGRSRMTDGRRVGLWRVWDEEGRLFEEVEYEATSTNYRLFLSDGSLALQLSQGRFAEAEATLLPASDNLLQVLGRRSDYYQLLITLFERQGDQANALAAQTSLETLLSMKNVTEGQLPRSLIQNVL